MFLEFPYLLRESGHLFRGSTLRLRLLAHPLHLPQPHPQQVRPPIEVLDWTSLQSFLGREAVIAEEVGRLKLHKQPDMVPIGPNLIERSQRALFLTKEWIPNEGFLIKTNILWLDYSKEDKAPHFHLYSQNDVWSSPEVFRKTNEHHWPATPLYYGNDVTRALSFACTTLTGRNSVWNLRMSENNNSNYYLQRALYMPWALQSLAISLQDRHDGQGGYQPGIPGRIRNRIQRDFKYVQSLEVWI